LARPGCVGGWALAPAALDDGSVEAAELEAVQGAEHGQEDGDDEDGDHGLAPQQVELGLAVQSRPIKLEPQD
jgi:hypothetical protein